MKLMFITNKTDIAKHAIDCNVDRIFIDLEILGKHERQGHLDTVISDHSVCDVKKIRFALPNAELLVRINPLNKNTKKEIDSVIEFGADIIMLPMFFSNVEIETVGAMIAGRAKFVPLIETKLAAESLVNYVDSPYISEFYIGLNDLHRDLNLSFMFELLSTGYVEGLVDIIKKANKPFGFGGIACVGEGLLPAELILAEHVRLGSSSVILSRSFHQRSKTLDELKSKVDLELEVNKLYDALNALTLRSSLKIEQDKISLDSIVSKIVEDI